MTPHFQVFVLEEAGGTKLYCHTFLFGKEFDFEFNLKSKFQIGLPKIYGFQLIGPNLILFWGNWSKILEAKWNAKIEVGIRFNERDGKQVEIFEFDVLREGGRADLLLSESATTMLQLTEDGRDGTLELRAQCFDLIYKIKSKPFRWLSRNKEYCEKCVMINIVKNGEVVKSEIHRIQNDSDTTSKRFIERNKYRIV